MRHKNSLPNYSFGAKFDTQIKCMKCIRVKILFLIVLIPTLRFLTLTLEILARMSAWTLERRNFKRVILSNEILVHLLMGFFC